MRIIEIMNPSWTMPMRITEKNEASLKLNLVFNNERLRRPNEIAYKIRKTNTLNVARSCAYDW